MGNRFDKKSPFRITADRQTKKRGIGDDDDGDSKLRAQNDLRFFLSFDRALCCRCAHCKKQEKCSIFHFLSPFALLL